MKKINLLFFALLAMLSFSACTNDNKKEKQAIEDTIKVLYSQQLNFRTIDTSLVSPALNLIFEKAKQKEQLSVDAIKNSAYPTDKAEIIEGDIFTSLYEGATDLKINDIKIEKNQAIVKVFFTNNHYNQNWEEDLLMIKTNTWKLDNIYYNTKYNTRGYKDLQELIINFYNK